MRLLLLIIPFVVFSCKPDSNNYGKYTVEAGKKDFTPNIFPSSNPAADYEGTVTLDTSCWYDDLPGEDNYDWNKICGLYRYTDYSTTKNSIMIAWRPKLTEKYMYDICVYENYLDSKGNNNHPHEDKIILLKAGDSMPFYFKNNKGIYTVSLNNTVSVKQDNPIELFTTGLISAWFGGTSPAPHKMWLWYQMKRK